MSKYDTEQFVPSPSHELVCCICHCVLHDPVQTPCEHVFCRICIETWLESHQSCPTCRRQGVKKVDLVDTVPLIRNMIQSLTMKCDNAENGCLDLLKLEAYETHIDNCPFALIQCKFKKCGQKFLRRHLSEHEDELCDHRETQCEADCGLMIPLKEMDDHSCLETLKRTLAERREELEKMKQYTQELLEQKNTLGQQRVQLERQLNMARERLERTQNRTYTESDSSWTIPDGSSLEDSDMEEVDIIQLAEAYSSDHNGDLRVMPIRSSRAQAGSAVTTETVQEEIRTNVENNNNRRYPLRDRNVTTNQDNTSGDETEPEVANGGNESDSSSSSSSSSSSPSSSPSSSMASIGSSNISPPFPSSLRLISEGQRRETSRISVYPCSDSDSSDTAYSYSQSPRQDENHTLSDSSRTSGRSNSLSSISLLSRRSATSSSSSASNSDTDGNNTKISGDGDASLSSDSSDSPANYSDGNDDSENSGSEVELLQEEATIGKRRLMGKSTQREETKKGKRKTVTNESSENESNTYSQKKKKKMYTNSI